MAPTASPEIKEIRIKRVRDLNQPAQRQVMQQLERIREENPDFQFKGYAEVSYIETSPLSVFDIQPIEGEPSGVIGKTFADILKAVNDSR